LKAKLTQCFVFVVLTCASLCTTAVNAADFVFASKSTTIELGQQFDTAMNAELIALEAAQSLHPQRRFEESHYFFTPPRNALGFDLGHGPFVAMQTGNKNAFDAVAMGWMVGISRPNTNISGLNIGMGLMVEGDFKSLTRGFLANDFDRDRNIHDRQSGGTGFIIMTSFTF
jgi:hypothetical protein